MHISHLPNPERCLVAAATDSMKQQAAGSRDTARKVISEATVLQTYHVAQIRVHDERVIQRIKISNVLNARVPIDLIPHMSDIMCMCCILTVPQTTVIKEGP